MKRLLLALVIASIAVSSFALDFAVGAGVNGGLGSSTAKMTMTILGTDVTMGSTQKTLDLNFQAVASIKYAQLGIGYLMAKDNGMVVSATGAADQNVDATKSTQSFLTIEALGKYPLALGGVTVVPMAGLEYDVCVGLTDSNGDKVDSSTITDTKGAEAGYGYFNSLSAKLGVGAEFAVSPKLSLRPQILGSFGLYTPQNSDVKQFVEGQGLKYSSYSLGITAGVVVAYQL
jgi:hypothetical protein